MKNLILAAFAILILASCQEQKIGYVDSGKVINEYQEKKDIEEKFKGKEEAFKKRADSIGKAFQFEVQKYNAEKPRMSSKSIQTKEQELLEPILTKARKAIEDVATEGNFTYIFDKSSGNILYAKESENVIALVKKKLGL